MISIKYQANVCRHIVYYIISAFISGLCTHRTQADIIYTFDSYCKFVLERKKELLTPWLCFKNHGI